MPCSAGDVNARYGQDPGPGFYTHVSDQHGPYSVRVMSATSHEAPYPVFNSRPPNIRNDLGNPLIEPHHPAGFLL